jgi:predicted PP-loop superfamily ATPase
MPTPPIDFKLDAILLRLTRIEKRMLNLTALNAQVDATVATMSEAVSFIQAHLTELEAAVAVAPGTDAASAAVDAIIAKLKVKTDELAHVLHARAAAPVEPVAPEVQ